MFNKSIEFITKEDSRNPTFHNLKNFFTRIVEQSFYYEEFSGESHYSSKSISSDYKVKLYFIAIIAVSLLL